MKQENQFQMNLIASQHRQHPPPLQHDLNLSHDTSWPPTAKSTLTTTTSPMTSWQAGRIQADIPRGWTSGTTSGGSHHTEREGARRYNIPKGWESGQAAQIPLQKGGGYYSGTDFSDEESPDPYRTLERPPPPPLRPEGNIASQKQSYPRSQQSHPRAQQSYSGAQQSYPGVQQSYPGAQQKVTLPRIQHQSHSVV